LHGAKEYRNAEMLKFRDAEISGCDLGNTASYEFTALDLLQGVDGHQNV